MDHPALSDLMEASFLASGQIGLTIGTLILIVLSALFSGSEVAYFSITPKELQKLRETHVQQPNRIIMLLARPKRLLATILICNNLVNIGIILLSTFLVEGWTNGSDFSETELFLLQVLAVTFVILLFGEVIPKVFANRNNILIARMMAMPLHLLSSFFKPLSLILVKFSNLIDNRIKRPSNTISVDELEHALEITLGSQTQNSEEQKILKGIVKFGSTEVKQIMTSRTEIVAVNQDTQFQVLVSKILSYGYSRIPVFEQDMDDIKGVLHIKDLLPHLDKTDYDWKSLMREPNFVSENKKISELLTHFQEHKNHLAIAVDEYGGTSGIITLEDIIEEIVGDISDEFDGEDVVYSKVDDKTYIFEAKTSLVDLYRVLNISGEDFEKAKGESGSLGGFLLEQYGKIPKKGDTLSFGSFDFVIETADQRKISRVKVMFK